MSNIRKYRDIYPTIAENVYVDQTSVLAGDITIGDDSSVWPLVAARGDVNTITIGARTNIQDGTVLHVSRASKSQPEGSPLAIGDDVTVGHKAVLHGCTIGNRVLVGMGCVIMDDVVIGDDVIIGAGSVVPPRKHLESGFLYVGNPAKQKRPLNEAEKRFLPESAANYVILKNEYMQDM